MGDGRRESDQAFGIDIGGTGIKGAVVDTTTGELVTERKRILTPQPATPDAVAAGRRRSSSPRPAGPARSAPPSRR